MPPIRVKYPRGGRGDFKLLVSYRRSDGKLVVTREGYGKNYREALDNADAQLAPGTWIRICISNPNTIYADVQNAGVERRRVNAFRRFEGERVRVRKPEVR